MMAIYTIVFGLIFKGQYVGIENQTTMDYAIGIFLSITLFQMISEVINSSPGTIVNQPNLVKKVVFPLEILPLANVAAALFQFGISLLLVLFGALAFGDGLSLSCLLVPLILLPLFPLAIGLGLILASLGVFLRDIQQAAGPISMILMYCSAVFYSVSMIPARLWEFLQYNPLIHVIEQSRRALLWHLPVQWGSITYSLFVGLVTLLLGIMLFKKLKPAFADVL